MQDEKLVIPNVYAWELSPTLDELLCQTRWKPENDPANTGKLELPGGKWQAYESAWDCVAREVHEESGCTFVGAHALPTAVRHGVVVEAVQPAVVVNILEGYSPSALIVLPGIATGHPSARSDEARDARFLSKAQLEELLANSPDEITPLTRHVLQICLPQWQSLSRTVKEHTEPR